MPTILSLEGLCKSFGAVKVAEDMSFTIEEGEALGVIGPNGAGKSSLFNLITGTLAPESGTIFFAGSDITKVPAPERCHRGIARSFQIPQPFGDMSVFENVLVGATQGARMHGSEADEECLEILETTGLIDKANARAGSLTLLQRKRLELARALAVRPRLLLLDEIAGGLNDAECHELVETIPAIRAKGTTIVWIEHIVHALLAVVDRLLVIDFGCMIAEGDPHEVIASKEVREIYMGLDVDA